VRRAAISACLAVVLSAFGAGGVARAADAVSTALPAAAASEVEPNDSPAAATEIGSGARVRGTVWPFDDVDLYRFRAAARDRVFATVMTNGSASVANAQLRLLDSDGAVVEFDEDDGSLSASSPSIAGATIPATGTYYLQVKATRLGDTIRPYDLLLTVRSGAPAAETELNDGPAGANPLADGFVAGTLAPADQDWYALELNAGDTVFVSLDLDPERDGTAFNGRLGFGAGAGAGALAVVDDQSTSGPGDPPSEAYVATVRTAGTYFVRVDSADAAAAGTYQLSATVIPAVQRSCRTYAVTPTPGTIPDQGSVTFPINVPDAATIDHMAVALDVTHARMGDLDVTLQAPTGNQIALFTDIGSTAAGSPTQMQVLFDEDAGSAPQTPALTWASLQPEPAARLSYFSGQPAAGTWNLTLYDDAPGDTGTLARAELILCARPAEGPAETVFSAGFESGSDGFTHSGTREQWERGLPATQQARAENNTVVASLTSCAEGTSCFKTNLDGPYDLFTSQDLVSPPISLAGRTGTIYASWAMWYQLEEADADSATVSVEQDGGGDPRPLFTWLGATMSQNVGGLVQTGAPFAAGWGVHRADISAYAGRTIRLRFSSALRRFGQPRWHGDR
jgi:subtilisin-like proprotein convertase family protein